MLIPVIPVLYTPRILTLLVWTLYAAGAAAVAAAARVVGRPVPRAVFAAFALLPVLFLLPGFAGDRTPIPVQDVRLFSPWTALPPPLGAPEPPRNPNLSDVALQIAPWTEAVRLSWRSGALPWLDRWNGCGMPLAGNPQSGAFSPFTLAGLPLPLARAATLAEALKLLAALAGAWLWFRELRVSPPAAFLGAVAFGFSLLMTVWLPWPIASVVALWPWALFLLERLDDPAGRARAAALLTAVLVAWAAAGHPESSALGAAFALLWTGFRLLSRGWTSPAAVVRTALLAAVVAAGLSAPLLLPQVRAIRASNRRARAEEALAIVATLGRPHAPWWRPGFVTPFFPRAYGDAVRAPMLAQAVYSFPEISSAYVGASAWLLALLTLRPGSKRRSEALGLAAIAVLALAITARCWPFIEILARIPGLGVMITVRFQAWITLAAAALAALEFDRFRRDLAADRRQALWIPAAAAAFGAAAAAVFLRHGPAFAAVGGQRAAAMWLATLGAILAAIAAAGAIAALPSLRAAARAGIVFVTLAAASIGELFAAAIPLARFGPSSALFPATPLVGFLRGRPGTFRVIGLDTAIFPGSNVFAGVEDVRTHDPLERRDYVEYLDAAAGYSAAEYFKKIRDPDAAALDLLNVAYAVGGPGQAAPGARWERVYAGNDGAVFRNRTVRQRVWAPPVVEPVGRAPAGHAEDAFAAFGLAPAEIVRRTADGNTALVVSDGPAPLPATLPGAPVPSVGAIREEGTSLSFTAALPGDRPAVVVASEVQDGGWRARDEKGPLDTGRANGPFLAIAVRPGRHRVTLAYEPPGLRAGVAAAAACALAGIGALLFRKRRPAVTY